MNRVSSPDKSTSRRGFGFRRNNRGSVLLLVMIAAPVAAALFFSLIEMVLISRKQVLINRNMVSYSSVMDAVIDYTNYAIKNRWCMTDTWSRDTTNCDINHARNFERMLFDQNAINALRDLNSTNGSFSSANAVLDQINATLNVSDLVNGHPLSNTLTNLQKLGKAVDKINVTVTRVNNTNIPRRGREIYLDVKVTLMSGSVIFRNLTAISATSRLMLTPRELNYFSLIVPRDMYLDGTMSTTFGDFSVPSGAGGVGYSFESPVFVNGDIHIPNQTGGGYTPATFANKVILGGPNSAGNGGRLMLGASPYSAPNSGALSSYLYSVMANFGGFKKGVDVDGIRDQGLEVLAGGTAGAPPSTAEAQQCIGINDIYYKLHSTRNTDLVIKPRVLPAPPPANTSELGFYLGLTQGNMFIDQELKPYFPEGQQTKAILTNVISGIKSSKRLDGKATTYFRFDSGSSLNALGKDAAGTPSRMTVKFTLMPDTKATMTYTPNAKVEVELVPVVINGTDGTPSGRYERSVFDLRVRTTGTQAAANIQYFSLYIKAYDLGTFGGRELRNPLPTDADSSQMPGHSTEGWLYFRMVGNTLQWIDSTGAPMVPPATYAKLSNRLPTPPTGFSAAPTPVPSPAILTPPAGVPVTQLPDETRSYEYYVRQCTSNSGGTNGSAFKAIGWGSPFLASTRYSWHFAPDTGAAAVPDGAYNSIPATGPGITINNGTFYVNSIVGNCVIPATTSVAAGFLTCDKLTIAARATPLMLIGTFIVNSTDISSSAIASGITFRSIYHPQSLDVLKSVGAMKDINGNVCPSQLPFPIWWPTLSSAQYDMLRKCNAISLRDKANPFTWSSVNPDCGVAGANITQCQKHTLNFILSEISRTSELQ